jgi:hypothetical protein
MNRIRATLAFGLVLLLAACYPPVTMRPVGSTAGIRNDAALAGTWRTLPHDDDKGGGYFHFLPRKDGGYLVIAVPEAGSESEDVLIAMVTSARFAPGFGYLNAVLSDPRGIRLPDNPPGTVPVLYRFDAKGTLSLYLPDEKATKAAIRAHRIAGDTGKSDTDDAKITADAKALDAFFRSPEGQALFTKPFAMMRRDR